MPRLLAVTTSYPMQDNPTSGIFVAKILQYLPADWEITILTPATAHDTTPHREGRLTVQPVVYAPRTWMRLAHAPGGIMPQLRRQPWLISLVPVLLLCLTWSLLRHARRHDLIYANWALPGAIAGLIGRCYHRPVVTALRGDDVHQAEHSRIQHLFLRLSVRYACRLTAVSTDFAEQLQHLLGPLEHLSVVHNGVDEQLLRLPVAHRPAHSPTLHLLSIGSLIPRKDHRCLIEALAALPRQDWHLRILGEGPSRQDLQSLIAQHHLQDRIELVGLVPPDQISKVLATHEVLVHASLSEGRSNAILEAMAAARMIIASDIPSQRELLAPDAGWLFTPGDSAALCAALLRLWQPHETTALGANARQRILQLGLTWPAAGQQLDRILRSCLHP